MVLPIGTASTNPSRVGYDDHKAAILKYEQQQRKVHSRPSSGI
jgi:hypothetical protein